MVTRMAVQWRGVVPVAQSCPVLTCPGADVPTCLFRLSLWYVICEEVVSLTLLLLLLLLLPQYLVVVVSMF